MTVKQYRDQFANNDMPGKFILSVKINGKWRLESGTDSLTELDEQIKMAVRENGRDNVRVYVLVQVPLEPGARQEELEEHHIQVPVEDRSFMLSHYPDLIKEYGTRQPEPGRDSKGAPLGLRVQDQPGDEEWGFEHDGKRVSALDHYIRTQVDSEQRVGHEIPDNSADHS